MAAACPSKLSCLEQTDELQLLIVASNVNARNGHDSPIATSSWHTYSSPFHVTVLTPERHKGIQGAYLSTRCELFAFVLISLSFHCPVLFIRALVCV